tara:strand:+ start:2532 stop:3347 length:816 start_codon:yes stop_codon:yes gene_type:complete
MKIFKSKNKLQKAITNIKNISFVPTMGDLHDGHTSLIKKSKKFKGKSLVSIFINPKQFNKKKDFLTYPRNLTKDLRILKRLKVDFVYLPNIKDIFSFKPNNKVFLSKFSKKLCGANRPGHFEGVLNVVNRFLEIIKPKYLFLGIKDFQQLQLINSHILKKKINTRIISCKTIRRVDGVAYSSRNQNLSIKQLAIAANVFRYIKKTKKILKKNLKNFNLTKFKNDLIVLGVSKIDYIKLYNLQTLKKPKNRKENFNIFIAYYLNNVRLIDNF